MWDTSQHNRMVVVGQDLWGSSSSSLLLKQGWLPRSMSRLQSQTPAVGKVPEASWLLRGKERNSQKMLCPDGKRCPHGFCMIKQILVEMGFGHKEIDGYQRRRTAPN